MKYKHLAYLFLISFVVCLTFSQLLYLTPKVSNFEYFYSFEYDCYPIGTHSENFRYALALYFAYIIAVSLLHHYRNVILSRLQLGRKVSLLILPILLYIVLTQNIETLIKVLPEYRNEPQAYCGYMSDFIMFLYTLFALMAWGLIDLTFAPLLNRIIKVAPNN